MKDKKVAIELAILGLLAVVLAGFFFYVQFGILPIEKQFTELGFLPLTAIDLNRIGGIKILDGNIASVQCEKKQSDFYRNPYLYCLIRYGKPPASKGTGEFWLGTYLALSGESKADLEQMMDRNFSTQQILVDFGTDHAIYKPHKNWADGNLFYQLFISGDNELYEEFSRNIKGCIENPCKEIRDYNFDQAGLLPLEVNDFRLTMLFFSPNSQKNLEGRYTRPRKKAEEAGFEHQLIEVRSFSGQDPLKDCNGCYFEELEKFGEWRIEITRYQDNKDSRPVATNESKKISISTYHILFQEPLSENQKLEFLKTFIAEWEKK